MPTNSLCGIKKTTSKKQLHSSDHRGYFFKSVQLLLPLLALYLLLFSFPAISSADLNDGLVAYYPFNGNANDESGNNNHGTVYGAQLIPDKFGNSDSAYNFDGVDDRIDLGNNTNLHISNAVTLSALIKSENNTENAYIIRNGLYYDLQYGMGITTSGQLRFSWYDGEFKLVVTNEAIPLSQWSHIAVVRKIDNSIEIYINGVLKSQGQATQETGGGGAVSIGSSQPGNDFQDFNGVIDELRIYNRALSVNEINQLVLASGRKFITATIDHTKVDETLTDFPVLIHLAEQSGINSFDASDLFDELSSNDDRKKISVQTQSGEECYAEIESWDFANKEAWLWVKVPEVSSTGDTILNIYYDRTLPDNVDYIGYTGEEVAQNVWDDNYVGVWHMAQDPSSGTNAILDSTNEPNHGTPYGNMNSGALIDGSSGKAIHFDGIDDYINLGTNSPLRQSTSITYSLIVKPETTARIGVGAAGGVGYGAVVVTNESFSFSWTPTIPGLDTILNPDNSFNLNNSWAAIDIVIDFANQTKTAYINGLPVAASLNRIVDNWIPRSSYNNGHFDSIGGWYVNSMTYGRSDFDNVAISNTPRSAAFIKASYHSNFDDLIIYSTTVDITPPNPITSFTVTPTGNCQAILDWSGYDETDQGIAYYRIYAERNPISDLSGLTEKGTVGAGNFTYTTSCTHIIICIKCSDSNVILLCWI